ncbi:L-carnitine dehydratase/bile acid-inducible protein F [Candidatus Rhodobacter oscarellae]|uniref:L-carnitine dehydratase/bile acid-inducible protein F n=1 Tax=Candidatus Rhodobacter oscarellae TaxID=1675527 RepID=A0A0J9E7J2_9RHOB|nr:CaiB/BaiF CoA-transferase family protein [Candidatus Rhodobacter lobularis]KMW58730.1 L-carnitine dehydratase/bile acid-inducible protein F [Candidatus Rhodobacter lobularis]
MPAKPLEGVRVLDLTNVLAGPFCCHQLAHLGAEVLKVEAPGRGDLARQLGQDEGLSAQNMGISFLAPNPGKRSMTLNLKSEAGKDILRRLVARSDVLVENFRPGVMDRLGLGYEALKAENPRLIYCAISGFGQDGPLRDRPAYDQIIQGMAGAMAITGDAGSAPLRAGWPVADTVGGLTAAMAISAALNARPRGGFIDVAMLDSLLATMGWAVSNLLVGGVHPVPAGNENLTSAPSAAYQCADAPINIAANKQEQWELLARHLGLAEMLADPDFATRADRKANRHALNARIAAVLRSRDASVWVEELNAIGVPAGPVLSMEEALQQPQYQQRDQVAGFTLRDGRSVEVVRTGVQIDGAPLTVEAGPPELGADTETVLTELGLSEAEIAELHKEGAL